MAKDKSTKERQREKDRRAARQRSIERNAAARRTLMRAVEDQNSARSLAVIASVSPEKLANDMASPIVPEPAHYREMLLFLKEREAHKTIESLAAYLLENHDSKFYPPGVLFAFPKEGERCTVDSLPTTVRIWIDDYRKLLSAKMERSNAATCFWLAWEAVDSEAGFVPVVYGLKLSGESAMWFLDLEGNWFAGTNVETYQANTENTRSQTTLSEYLMGYEPALWFAFEACGGIGDTSLLSYADARLETALKTITVIQGELLDTVLALSLSADECAAQVDRLLDEIDALERDRTDAQRQQHRLQLAVDEADRQVADLRVNALAQARYATPRVPAISLAAQLARVF